ncbi:hypothetical protein EYF80_026784 [Liparis tanakae]|uniref:Uncharacterized protein n=1 Tax=Liparis tanakae TaxID=230148 RepID=A0A4Z2HCG6_9TELE|nr:hypothetical protein EYF80_026784 [Liparis tanakae]
MTHAAALQWGLEKHDDTSELSCECWGLGGSGGSGVGPHRSRCPRPAGGWGSGGCMLRVEVPFDDRPADLRQRPAADRRA